MEGRPQFLKMNPEREEDPPQRDVGCIDYKACLSLAARRNLCLDCSRCEAASQTEALPGLPAAPAPHGPGRREAGRATR